MPPKVLAWKPGKVVEINIHEVNSKLRLDESQKNRSACSPILISSEGKLRQTIEHQQ